MHSGYDKLVHPHVCTYLTYSHSVDYSQSQLDDEIVNVDKSGMNMLTCPIGGIFVQSHCNPHSGMALPLSRTLGMTKGSSLGLLPRGRPCNHSEWSPLRRLLLR